MNDLFVVPLTKGHFAIVDAEDAPLVSERNWFSATFRTSGPYAISGASGNTVYMHRVVMSAPKGKVVDHINHNGLDNRRSNLRICTRGENRRHLNGAQANNQTGYLGVGMDRNRPRARIKINGQLITIGHFDTLEEAARARDRAAIQLHGEFASLNFPDERLASG